MRRSMDYIYSADEEKIVIEVEQRSSRQRRNSRNRRISLLRNKYRKFIGFYIFQDMLE